MISLENLELYFGERALFGGISARIGPRDRIGLVGNNGAGKSTLLKVLMNEAELDGGSIQTPRECTLGYLPQDGITAEGRPLRDEAMSAFEDVIEVQRRLDLAYEHLQREREGSEAYTEALALAGELEHRLNDLEAHKMEAKTEKVLLGLGFSMEDMERDCGEFSGGWQMRAALAKLLLREPSLLLLDEPTNHLDLDSLRWLETYLQQYDGALMIISHDKAFLDALIKRTFHLTRGRLDVYNGNYSFFEKAAEERFEQMLKAYESQQKEIAHIQKFIDRFRAKASKATLVQSRIKMLERMEKVDVVENDESEVSFSFPPPPRSGHKVLSLEGLDKAYGELQIFRSLDLEFTRGEKVAIVGVNGAGKSTLMRILVGEEPFQAGKREMGHNAQLAFFAQHQAEALNPEKTVLEAAGEGATPDARAKLRSLLGAFLFSGDDVFKKVKVLSGGEKNRLALCKMLLHPANCLIFDEPTNHLDMRSKAVLQDALAEYEGTVIIVSHDRSFLDPIVKRVVEVKRSGVRNFIGNVSDYVQKTEEEARQAAATHKASTQPTNEAAKKSRSDGMSPRERRQQEAALRRELAPLKKKAQELEKEIEELEGKIATYEKDMADPEFFKNGAETTRAMQDYDKIKARVTAAMDEWEQTLTQISEKEEVAAP